MIFILVLIFLAIFLVLYLATPKLPKISCTNLYEKSKYTLSVIIPCYNEEDRIHLCSQDIEKTLPDFHIPVNEIEFIFINDGSKDKTADKLESIKQSHPDWNTTIINMPTNKGKGYGVRLGMLHAKGEFCMYMDCDAAASLSSTKILWDTSYDVLIGSRSHLMTESKIKRSNFRKFLMKSFRLFLYIFGVKTIKDTQCGFKIFKRKAAQLIFKNARIDRFLFDVELIIIAEHFGMKIKEVAIPWNEVPGSKMSLIKDSIKMAIDLVLLRFGIIFQLRRITK